MPVLSMEGAELEEQAGSHACISLLSYFKFASENKGWTAIQIEKNWIQAPKGCLLFFSKIPFFLSFIQSFHKNLSICFVPGTVLVMGVLQQAAHLLSAHVELTVGQGMQTLNK